MMAEVVVRDGAGSTPSDRDGLRELFMQIVASLAEGELTHSPPFDLSMSAALASNLDRNDLALKLAEVSAARDVGYQVMIYGLIPGDDDESLRREIINTTVGSTRLLFALLDGLMDELDARRTAWQAAD